MMFINDVEEESADMDMSREERDDDSDSFLESGRCERNYGRHYHISTSLSQSQIMSEVWHFLSCTVTVTALWYVGPVTLV